MKPLEVLNGSTKKELASELTRALLPLLHIVHKALGRKGNVTFAQGKQAIDDALQVVEGMGDAISLADYVGVYYPDALQTYKAWSDAKWGLEPGDWVAVVGENGNRYKFIECRNANADCPATHYVFGLDDAESLIVRAETLHTTIRPVRK